MLFSEPKIPQFHSSTAHRSRSSVSVLFSEPKIPQFLPRSPAVRSSHRFSALQRAENSSIRETFRQPAQNALFQCSSASRKFLNRLPRRAPVAAQWFQCSSASRKFLNRCTFAVAAPYHRVSVLFSEPKIPQCEWYTSSVVDHQKFQCSSASRKFLNSKTRRFSGTIKVRFQCSSASRKFLNLVFPALPPLIVDRFSALQRAENSSMDIDADSEVIIFEFQCSSASRKFLNS